MPMQSEPPLEEAPADNANRAMRLSFAYEGSEVRLVEQQNLQKVTQPSDPIDTRQYRERSGFWVEIQDGQGQPLYRRIMDDHFEPSIEVRSQDPEYPLERIPIDRPRGTFSVIVPAFPDADAVVLFGSPIDSRDARAAMQPAREIARFGLRRQGASDRRPEDAQ